MAAVIDLIFPDSSDDDLDIEDFRKQTPVKASSSVTSVSSTRKRKLDSLRYYNLGSLRNVRMSSLVHCKHNVLCLRHLLHIPTKQFFCRASIPSRQFSGTSSEETKDPGGEEGSCGSPSSYVHACVALGSAQWPFPFWQLGETEGRGGGFRFYDISPFASLCGVNDGIA